MPNLPKKNPPSEKWEHYTVWDRINDLIYSLPNYFETELLVKGINVTEIFSIGGAFSTIVDTQVVEILNRLRDIWDPENKYSNYSFVRQAQTFPDVLFRNIEDENDIIFGIELKSWYVLSKEAEPSFRYKITPDACAEQDLLVVIPWLLSEVISGTPKLLTPYKELAKYAAEYRNYYWQKSRIERGFTSEIRKPPERDRHAYPDSKKESSDAAMEDKGNNFGRIARAGILDTYNRKIKQLDYLGIKIIHWISFFKAVSETSTDTKIEDKIQRIKEKMVDEAEVGLPPERQAIFLEILERIEKLWHQTNG